MLWLVQVAPPLLVTIIAPWLPTMRKFLSCAINCATNSRNSEKGGLVTTMSACWSSAMVSAPRKSPSPWKHLIPISPGPGHLESPASRRLLGSAATGAIGVLVGVAIGMSLVSPRAIPRGK